MIRILTNLGDSVLLLPASAALLAYLAIRGERRLAGAWLATLGLCLGVTLALKLYFNACSVDLGHLVLRSPSGHAAFTALFYVSLAVVAGQGRDPGTRFALSTAATLLATAIAVSRPLIGVHSPAEAVAGLAMGLAGAAFFRSLVRHESRRVGLRPLVASTLLAALLLNGTHLSAEPYIRDIALRIADRVDACN